MVHLLESLGFRLACSSFLSSKFASQVNTIYGGAQLLVSGCLESMCHKFNSQGLGLRILELMIASPKSGGFNSRVPVLRVPLRFRVPGSRVSGYQGPGSQGPRSRVSAPDFRLCLSIGREFQSLAVRVKKPLT